MKPPQGPQAVRQVVGRLIEVLGERAAKPEVQGRPGDLDDAVVRLGSLTFALEWKQSGRTAQVSAAVDRVRRRASAVGRSAIPLVAVPYMGPVGRRLCQDAGVAWLDLSGNARILTHGVHVLVEGKPNRFKQRGRPSTVFAPKSARIARWLLMHPDRSPTQRNLASATGMDEGFTSRIVARLEADDLIVRSVGGGIRPRDPDLMLDAWREAYDFSKHQIVRGHVPARTGDALLHQLADAIRHHGIRYAATGLAAAWLLDKFAQFRLVTMYVLDPAPSDLLAGLGFREEASGANVWLVTPNDEGVLHGSTDRSGVACVHPVQAYLDLDAHPERAGEAATRLRANFLKWSSHG